MYNFIRISNKQIKEKFSLSINYIYLLIHNLYIQKLYNIFLGESLNSFHIFNIEFNGYKNILSLTKILKFLM